MKPFSILLVLTVICFSANCTETSYRGSTPAHPDVKEFLSIPLKDSIDFIKWTVSMHADRYELDCRYGISKGGTNGFINEKTTKFSGVLEKQGFYYQLRQGKKILYLLEINTNLFHLLDKKKNMLIGNGGYSYVLSSNTPVPTDRFNPIFKGTTTQHMMAFQGRTPCQELAKMMGLAKNADCVKMKWYVILYTDPVSGKPSYYLKGGRGYKKETMTRGNWEITRGKDGRVIYKLDPDKKNATIYLLQADDNILFFTDAAGRLLVGNEDFGYTLNRTEDREPAPAAL